MKIFKNIRDWFKIKYLFSDDVTIPTKQDTDQTDVRTRETIKRVRKAFAAQEQSMQARAMKPHDPSCLDVVNCKKRKCFKWEPDKIVSEPKEVKRGD